MTASLRETALALATAKVAVMPCHPLSKQPYGPLAPHGCHSATTDPAKADVWWGAIPDLNLAIATGRVSGLWVLDIDGHEGERTIAVLEEPHGKLPASVEVITPNGGRHVYFANPPSLVIPNTVGKIGAGVDTRGDNGYVVAPPSMLEGGKCYVRSVDSSDMIASAPHWLLDLVTTNTANGHRPIPTEEWHKLIVDGVDEGARNDAMAKIAGHLLRRGVNGIVAYELLQAWNMMNCRPPLEPEEVNTVFTSIAGREAKRRGL
jgi:hypothetical protein